MKEIIAFIVALFFIVSIIFFAATPAGRGLWNSWFFEVQKVDDATRYETRKEVEDSCRAMIASYTSDELTYNQYKDSEKEDEQSWAAQAKMRANKTTASYNEYVLKNSFVWEGNVPRDIRTNLPYID